MEDARRPEHERRHRPSERRAELRPHSAAELAGGQCDEEDGPGAARETREPQRIEGVTGQVSYCERKHRHERREVDVPKREVPRRGQEVQLVAIPAVAAEERRGESDEHHRRGRASEEGGRDRCAFRPSR